MKAFEARQKSLKNQFEWIEKKIKKAIEKGESQIIVEKTPLYEEVIEKLLDDGFDLLIIADHVGAFTRISMLGSEEGGIGELYYVPIEWEFCDSDDEDDDDYDEEYDEDDCEDDVEEVCDEDILDEDNSEVIEDGECFSEDCNVEEEMASKEEETIDTPEVIEESNDEEVTSEAATGEDAEPEQC